MSAGGISLSQLLPAPSQSSWDRQEERDRAAEKASTAMVTAARAAPPYGKRKGWIPRTVDDFGDGGAFPEIHVAQYPHNLGRGEGESNKSGQLAVQLDASGKVKYDLLARQGNRKDKIIYSKFTDLLPTEVKDDDDPELQRPEEEDESVIEATEKTRIALEKLTSSKISAAMPVRAAEKQEPAQYIRYTPSQQGQAFNSGAKQRVIRMVEVQKDPMEPARFKINRKVPRGPPSPPAPVMHSPTRKVTAKEQQDWKIPPCISNWKNAKGYTIPLDKRLAADGRGLQQVHINENFSKLAEALYIADRKAREAVEMRASLEKKLAQKEKEAKESKLRELAQKAREERAGIRPSAKDEGEKERDELRFERHKDRQRQRNIERAAPERRGKLEKERERDISEQIALGMPAKTTTTGEGLFDARLFNQSKGMDSGFADDETYGVYDKPWRKDGDMAQNIYRPSKNIDSEMYGGKEDLEALRSNKRFVADKGFQGTEGGAAGGQSRSGPVQFEKEADDPFGLDAFLDTAKRASKRKDDDGDRRREDRGRDDRKRRKDYD